MKSYNITMFVHALNVMTVWILKDHNLGKPPHFFRRKLRPPWLCWEFMFKHDTLHLNSCYNNRTSVFEFRSHFQCWINTRNKPWLSEFFWIFFIEAVCLKCIPHIDFELLLNKRVDVLQKNVLCCSLPGRLYIKRNFARRSQCMNTTEYAWQDLKQFSK